MTDTERIATALLGWHPAPISDASPWRRYKHPTKNSYVLVNKADGSIAGSMVAGEWPDFTTLDGCNAFERALANNLLFSDYAHAIWYECAQGFNLNDYPNPVAVTRAVIFATPAQRVAACIKVLDEAGL